MKEYIIQSGSEYFCDTTFATEPIFTGKVEHAHRFTHHGIARLVVKAILPKANRCVILTLSAKGKVINCKFCGEVPRFCECKLKPGEKPTRDPH